MHPRPISDLVFELKSKCSWLEEKIFEDTPLSPAEYKGIYVLSADDQISAAEFAVRMGISPSRTSRIIEKMLSDGYLSANHPEGNRKSILLSLTQKGRTVQKKVHELLDECNKSIEEKLTKKQVNSICESLQELINVMG